MDSFLSSLPSDIIIHRFSDRVPNELYRAMNFAVQYCMDKNIKFVNFIQDDYQYLYEDENMIDKVHGLFRKHKNIAQVQTNMVWRRKKVGSHSIKSLAGENYAILKDKLVVDTGFTRVSVYKKTGFYPTEVISYDQNSEKTFGFGKNRYKNRVNGEIWFGNQCRKKGYSRALLLRPNMAMMFDCAYVRKWQRFGRYFPPPHEFYLKPFVEDEISKVNNKHDKRKFCHIEEMVSLWGWIATTHGKHNTEKIVNDIQ